MFKPDDSYELTGPWPEGRNVHGYHLHESGRCVGGSEGDSQATALTIGLQLAAAPMMLSILKQIAEGIDAEGINPAETQIMGVPSIEILNAVMEAEGMQCEGCETPGQPSRMISSTTGRLYHPTCLPEEEKKRIAEMEKAAAEDDVPY